MTKFGKFAAVCAAVVCAFGAVAGLLPAEYQEVEYVDSTGAEWIDTGVTNRETYQLEFKVAVLTLNQNRGPFGTYTGESANSTRLIVNSGSKTDWVVNFMTKTSGGGTTFAKATKAAGDVVEGWMRIDRAKLNTVELPLSRTESKIGTDDASTLKLFGRSGYATATRIYYFRILEGDEVKHNYVPCYKRDASGEVGLYDTVEGEFLGNDSGLGALVAGGTVEYVWTGAAGDCKWMTAGNWSVGGVVAVCPPRQASDNAVFLVDTTAEVCFDASVSFGTLNVTNKNLQLMFTQAEGVAVTCKTLDAGALAITDRYDGNVTFDGVNLTASGSSVMRPNRGKNFLLTNGAQLSVYDLKMCDAANVASLYVGDFTVESGSSLVVRDILQLGNNALLSISNGAVSAKTVYVNGVSKDGSSDGGGGIIKFYGESPQLSVSGKMVAENEGWTGGFGADVEFFVPVGGYASAPIQYAGSTAFMLKPASSVHAKTPVRFTVRGDSPILESEDVGVWPLVSCTGEGAIDSTGINMSTAVSTVTEALELTDGAKTMLYTRATPASCLVVTGAPLEFGTGDYGAQRGLTQGATRTLTAPTSDSENLTCTGYKIYDVAADGKRTFVSGGAETTFEYTHGTTRREVVWQWSRPDVYVSNADGDDVNNDGLSRDSPLKTIQVGIDKFDYAVVHVAPDTYLTSATTAIAEGKGVEVRGEGADAAGVVLKLTAGTVRVLDIAGEHSVVTNLTVTNGDAQRQGGVNMTAGLLAGCIVTHCSTKSMSYDGGGVYVKGGTVSHCVISNNCALGSGGNGKKGGGVYMTGGLVENCRILNNNASSGSAGAIGGGIYMTGGTVRGCLLVGNFASVSAFALSATSGTIENNTIVANNNSASRKMSVELGQRVKFRNNIVFGNTGVSGATANISGEFAGTAEYNATSPKIACGIGNTDNTPVFEDADAGDYRLQFCPLVNGAMLRPWMDAVFDLDGTPRVVGEWPDIGCFERPPSTGLLCTFSAESSGTADLADVTLTSIVDGDTMGIVYYWRVIRADGTVFTRSGAEESNPTFALGAGDYDIELAVTNGANRGAFARVEGAAKIRASVVYVNESGSDAYPYTSKENGAHDFTQAFELLAPGGTVYVADGVYDITARILLGGMFGTKVISLNGPDNCVIKAKGSGFVDTRQRMFELTDANSRLEGLTIAGGLKGRYNTGSTCETWGNVIVNNASAVVTNCVICDARGVSLGPDGAGVNISSGTIVDTTIVNIEENMSGGIAKKGVALYQTGGFVDRVRIVDCRTTGTSSSEGDGGLLFMSGGTIRNSLIASCKSTQSAPVYVGAGATMENCSIVANTNTQMSATLGTGTAAANNNHCGGLIAAAASTVVNTLVADNWSNFGNAESNLYCSASKEFDHCLVSDREILPGEGNVLTHPKFNRRAGDWRLRNSSPGVDQGRKLDWMDGTTDVKGTPRIQGVAPDIGCHEDFVHGLMLMVR